MTQKSEQAQQQLKQFRHLSLLVLNIEPLLPEVVGQVEQFVPDAGAERRTAAVVAMVTSLVRHLQPDKDRF